MEVYLKPLGQKSNHCYYVLQQKRYFRYLTNLYQYFLPIVHQNSAWNHKKLSPSLFPQLLNTHYCTIPTTCFSFACNQNRPPVSKSLKAQHILQMLKDGLSYNESQTRAQHSIIKCLYILYVNMNLPYYTHFPIPCLLIRPSEVLSP